MFLYFFQQRQLSPEPGSGGGNNYSLDDLDNEDEPVKDDDKPEKTPEEEAAEKEEAEAKLAEEKAAADKILSDKEEARKAKEEEDAKLAAQDTDDPEEDDFWAEVDKLRGETLDVDYGDVDPETPEGALIRENAVAEKAIDDYENYLQAKIPKAYAYMLHTMNGGTDEEFFKLAGTNEALPTPEELEASIELQQQIYTRNMKAKGVSDKAIAAAIKGLITDDELEEAAKEALADEEKLEKDRLESIKVAAEQEGAKRQKALGQMVAYVNDVVNTGVLDNITIPEKDRKPFIEHFNKNVRYENGKFLLVTELSDDNVIQNFKKEFFNFKGGKIDELIVKQARTENAKRLVKTIGKDKRVRTTADNNDSGFVGLGDL